MNENFLIVLMYLWALGNLAAALSVIYYRVVKPPHRQKQWSALIRCSLFLNMITVFIIFGEVWQHIYLWLLMTANLFLVSWSIRFMKDCYEAQLKGRKLTFQIIWVKRNIAYGTVEIDGIKYRAYIPPVWIKEYLDENGKLFPGTYKRYQAPMVQKAHFKRFVPVDNNKNRLLVELA